MADLVERLRNGLSSGPNTVRTPWGNTIEEAANEIERLRNVALAASDLIENIREHGIHDNWKSTANALREVNIEGLAPVDLSNQRGN